MSIYVGNLNYEVTKEDLTTVFEEYGTVSRVSLPTDRETGRPRGFGFVEMSSEDEETKAIESLDGAEWMGRELRVNKARPRESNRGGGGGGGRRFESSSRNYQEFTYLVLLFTKVAAQAELEVQRLLPQSHAKHDDGTNSKGYTSLCIRDRQRRIWNKLLGFTAFSLAKTARHRLRSLQQILLVVSS